MLKQDKKMDYTDKKIKQWRDQKPPKDISGCILGIILSFLCLLAIILSLVKYGN